jgi:hypothetical protein
MAATCTVTATITDPSGASLLGNALVRFRLRNYTGFVPVVSGTSVLCETQIDAYPNPAGAISQILTCNTAISPINTFYTVEFWNQGRIVTSANYYFNANTSLNTASNINPAPAPAGPSSIIFENNGTLNSSQTLLNLESTDSSVVITDKGAGTLNLQAVSQTNPFTFVNRISFVAEGLPLNSATIADGANMGMCCDFVNVSLQNSPIGYSASSVNPSYVQIESASPTTCGGFTDQQLNITPGGLQDWQIKVELTGTGNARRFWMGISDQLQSAVESVFNSDTPAANFIGFRYDANVDAHYQAICQTSASNQTVVDTGITPSAVHVLEFQSNGLGTITFYIQDLLVATINTNVPSANTALATLAVVDGLGSGTPKLNFYWTTALLNS